MFPVWHCPELYCCKCQQAAFVVAYSLEHSTEPKYATLSKPFVALNLWWQEQYRSRGFQFYACLTSSREPRIHGRAERRWQAGLHFIPVIHPLIPSRTSWEGRDAHAAASATSLFTSAPASRPTPWQLRCIMQMHALIGRFSFPCN